MSTINDENYLTFKQLMVKQPKQSLLKASLHDMFVGLFRSHLGSVSKSTQGQRLLKAHLMIFRSLNLGPLITRNAVLRL